MLRLSVRASVRGYKRLSAFLLELECWRRGLTSASRSLRREGRA